MIRTKSSSGADAEGIQFYKE